MRPVSRQASCRSASSHFWSSGSAASIVARPSFASCVTRYWSASHSTLDCGDLFACACKPLDRRLQHRVLQPLRQLRHVLGAQVQPRMLGRRNGNPRAVHLLPLHFGSDRQRRGQLPRVRPQRMRFSSRIPDVMSYSFLAHSTSNRAPHRPAKAIAGASVSSPAGTRPGSSQRPCADRAMPRQRLSTLGREVHRHFAAVRQVDHIDLSRLGQRRRPCLPSLRRRAASARKAAP